MECLVCGSESKMPVCKRCGKYFISLVALITGLALVGISLAYGLIKTGIYFLDLLKEASAPIKFAIGLSVGLFFILISKKLSSDSS